MQAFFQYKGLSGQIYMLSLCRALVSMGLMFMFPYLTFLLTEIQGLSATTASFIISFCSVGSIVGNFIGGHFSDKVGRKTTYLFAAALVTLTMLASAALCYSRFFILILLIFYVANSIIMPNISAMILDNSEEDNETTCYSLMYLAGNLGCAIGPMIGGLLFYNHLRILFLFMAVAFLFALIIVAATVSEAPHISAGIKTHPDNSNRKSTISIIRSKKGLLFFLILLSILTLCYINLDFALPILLNDLFGLNVGSKINSIVWTVNGLTIIVITPFVTTIMNRFSSRINSTIAAFLYFVGFGLYAFVGHPILFLLIVPIWTVGEIMLSTSSAILISDSCPVTHKGRAMALYELARNAGKLIGPLFAGLLLLIVSAKTVWLIIAAACLAVCLILYRMKEL